MFHLTHIDNIPSIFSYGAILSNRLVRERNINFKDCSDKIVQEYRELTIECFGKKYHLKDFVPIYFKMKTPMSYRIKYEPLCFIEINHDKLLKIQENKAKLILYTDGNAASLNTEFYLTKNSALENIDIDILSNDYWNDFEDGKRKFSAEILVNHSLPKDCFNCIYAKDSDVYLKLSHYIKKADITIPIHMANDRFF